MSVYEDHYGLGRRPFLESASASVYVAVPGHEVISRRLRYSLSGGDGPAVLFGAAGAGKTLLARRLAVGWNGTAVHVTFPALPAGELVAHLVEEFGGGPLGPTTFHESLRRLREELAAQVALGRRALLVIDEAQTIRDPDVFETLRLLLNFATDGPPDLSLLLVGTPEFLLDLPPGLADRVIARCLVGLLSVAETSAYVLGRLSAAGARAPLFSAEGLETIHRASGGLPRRINHLADLALLVAYARGLDVADEACVRAAAREFPRDELAA